MTSIPSVESQGRMLDDAHIFARQGSHGAAWMPLPKTVHLLGRSDLPYVGGCTVNRSDRRRPCR
eukprot:6201299-Pleurochrysis_carterae.AAC.1